MIDRVMSYTKVVISLREMLSSRGARGLLFVLTLSIARTGRRNGKHSPKRAALKTATHPARHEPPGFDFCPRSDVGRVLFNRKLKCVRADQGLVIVLLRHVCISQFVQGTT